jgi:glycosyltransferase involved in cell wall biosynthesis
MIAIEAMACGTPVIAFAEGGALDFVREGETGTFFRESTIASLTRSISTFHREDYDKDGLRRFAHEFRREVFLDKIRKEIALLVDCGERL